MEKYDDNYPISRLFYKIKDGKSNRNDILWTVITMKLLKDNLLIDLKVLNEVLYEMPMDYLAIVAVSSMNEYIRYLSSKIGHDKQEEYEKENEIYNKTYEKFYLDEKEIIIEKRLQK